MKLRHMLFLICLAIVVFILCSYFFQPKINEIYLNNQDKRSVIVVLSNPPRTTKEVTEFWNANKSKLQNILLNGKYEYFFICKQCV